jgi:hypothetical protein
MKRRHGERARVKSSSIVEPVVRRIDYVSREWFRFPFPRCWTYASSSALRAAVRSRIRRRGSDTVSKDGPRVSQPRMRSGRATNLNKKRTDSQSDLFRRT